MKICYILTTILILTANPIHGDTFRVPDEYETIQYAIYSSSDGDTVLVAEGTYTGAGNKNLDFNGRAILVKGESGPYDTFIDCENDGYGVRFDNSEEPDSWFYGFTIRNSSDPAIICDEASPTIERCHLVDNNAGLYYHDGGGIYCYRSSPVIDRCDIIGNYGAWGGGIYCDQSSPEIIDCEISDNYAACNGGGIECYDSSNAIITGCLVSGNVADWGGGIDCHSDSRAVITDCVISNNEASTNRGGGVRFCYSPGTLTDCIVSDNTAYSSGGGISCYDASATISRCIVSGNRATGSEYTFAYGGGIDLDLGSDAVITNCTITRNSVNWEGGGIRCYNSSDPVITHCTIADNTSDDHGGGISCGYYSLTITNCILWNNAPEEIYVDYGSQEPDVTFSDVCSGWPGEGNIDADPLFVDPEGDDYHLQESSPCIDSGTDAGIYDDLDGQMRPMGDGFDMGADEYRFYPDVLLEVEVLTPVVQKPGTFKVKLTGTNYESYVVECFLLTRFQLPSGEWYPRHGGYYQELPVRLPANYTGSKTMEYSIPGGAPKGTYLYEANLGIQPEIWTTDTGSFTVE